MKKLISIALVLSMIITMCACGAKKETVSNNTGDSSELTTESSDEVHVVNVGVLTMLNVSESEMKHYLDALNSSMEVLMMGGYLEINSNNYNGILNLDCKITFYDTLDAMLMALNAGDIDSMSVYYRTGQYLCATNDNLKLLYDFNFDKDLNAYAYLVLAGHLCNDFAFLMMEDNAALRDEFNSAIFDMKSDGTMDKLVKEQIVALLDGSEVKPVSIPEIEGAETVKVAITGSLPPMDYVAADGTPAGFNTAVLAEISKRINKNIELVVVDSIGRATALSSGTVDTVFWTRTNEMATNLTAMSEEDRSSQLNEYTSEMNDEELASFNEISETIDFEKFANIDMPDDTICTIPYYSDLVVPVKLKQSAR